MQTGAITTLTGGATRRRHGSNGRPPALEVRPSGVHDGVEAETNPRERALRVFVEERWT